MAYSLDGLARLLGADFWQAERAVRDGLLPPADLSRRRWSERAARELLPLAEQVRVLTGTVLADVGAWRASDFLRDKFGIPVTAGGVEELAARGVIDLAPQDRRYRGNQLYSGASLEALDDRQAVADAEAHRDRNAADAAAYMGIREADFKLLVKVGFIKPSRHVNGQWARFPLYSCAVLDAFLLRDDIDWDAVRATPRGRRTPLYALCEPELIMLTLANLGDGPVRW